MYSIRQPFCNSCFRTLGTNIQQTIRPSFRQYCVKINKSRKDVQIDTRRFYQAKQPKQLQSFILEKYYAFVENYGKILERRFPAAMRVYRVFTVGIRDFFSDFKTYFRLIQLLRNSPKNMKQMTAKEIELYYEMPRDMFRLAPVLLISALPFANYVVFPIAYYFPRKLLSSHFWSIQQKSDFALIHLKERLNHYPPLYRHMQSMSKLIKDRDLMRRWVDILGLLASGIQPNMADVLRCNELFEGNGLYALKNVSYSYLNELSHIHPLQLHSSLFKRQKLRDYALIIREIDEAIVRDGNVTVLTIDELKRACFRRGINPVNMTQEEMKTWLAQWLEISRTITYENLSLLLHAPILLGFNAPSNWLLIYSK